MLIFLLLLQYIFQQVVNGQAIEHHLWMLQPTVTTYKVQDLTRDQSEALRQRFRFVLLGATATSKMNWIIIIKKRMIILKMICWLLFIKSTSNDSPKEKRNSNPNVYPIPDVPRKFDVSSAISPFKKWPAARDVYPSKSKPTLDECRPFDLSLYGWLWTGAGQSSTHKSDIWQN